MKSHWIKSLLGSQSKNGEIFGGWRLALRAPAIVGALAVIVGLMSSTSAAQFQAPRRQVPRTVTVPIGRIIRLRLEESLSSKYNRVGDRFAATIVEPVRVNGRTALPEGTRVTGRVTSVRRARRRSRAGTLGVEFVSITLPNSDREYDIVATLTSLDETENERLDEEETIKGGSSKKRDAVFIGGGAGVGAVIGAISGGGKGTAIGAGAGAVAGIAGALFAKGKEVELDPGSEFGMRLERDLVVPVEARRTR